jgi:L-seryl-tRNA(Ser) seleniumtransferase
MGVMSDPRRSLPGVDSLLASAEFGPLLAGHPRSRVIRATRAVLDVLRGEMGEGARPTVPEDYDGYARRVADLVSILDRPSLRDVVNATGVVLHTNLGRAPLSRSTREAMLRAGEGYSNLEFDLEAGVRGSRYVHCVDLLREITGAPDALVVNNNAAAVVLAISTMAQGREVLVSRGELVEIGGGFRIPEMISRSGATLREVGTTNRTRLSDYRKAAEDGAAAAILKVHRSNFRISGFTEEATVGQLAELARELKLQLFHDLGSGLLADPGVLGLPEEPRAPDSLRNGAHAVAVSGDKLLGGPQAGIILGRAEIVARMRENPLTRAFRVDKVTLAGLEATLRHYLDPREALQEIPALRMISTPPEELESRSQAVARALGDTALEVRVVEGAGVVGGGTYPEVPLPGWTLRIRIPGVSSQETARRLRSGEPPIVARREDEEVVLDLRTVDPGDDETLVAALRGLSTPSSDTLSHRQASGLQDRDE